MKTFLSICLEKNGKIPIYKQLGDALLDLISQGILPPDSKLPPIRRMAESLKINSSTVVNAYKYLESKRAVYSFLGSGTYVAPLIGGVPAWRGDYKKPGFNLLLETEVKVDFASAAPPPELFPHAKVRRAIDLLLEKEGCGFFGNVDTKGYPPLISAFSERLAKEGVPIGAVAITDGLGKSFELAAASVVRKGDYVVLEKPAAYSRAGPYAQRGAKILQAPLENDGLNLERFEALLKMYRPRAAHISTYFQTPSNVSYSLEKKKAVLELCCKFGTIIVEEDVYSELAEQGKRVFIKSLDYRGSVIYVKSLTKTSFPWLNMSICVFPKKLAPLMERKLQECHTPDASMHMKILNALIEDGVYDDTAKIITDKYKLSQNALSEILSQELSDLAVFDRLSGGAGFWLKLIGGSSSKLAEACASKGVLVTPGSVYHNGGEEYFRIIAPYLSAEKMRDGVRTIRFELTKLRR